MTLIDQQFLREQVLNTVIQQMLSSITVCELGSNTHESDKYAIIDLYLSSKNEHVTIISCKAHCYDHTWLELMRWVERKDCVVSDIRQQVKRQLDHENVELTLSRSS